MTFEKPAVTQGVPPRRIEPSVSIPELVVGPPPPLRVRFLGPFRNEGVAWHEGLTLADGILLAEYEGPGQLELIAVFQARTGRYLTLRELETEAGLLLLFPGDLVVVR